MTIDQKLIDLKKKFDEDFKTASRELVVTDNFEKIFPDIHLSFLCHDLYGSTGKLTLETKWFQSLRDDDKRNVSYEDVIKLSEILPPIPLTFVKSSTTTFMPTVYMESLSEEQLKWFREELPVVPFTIRFSCQHCRRAKVEWFSKFDDEIISVSCQLPLTNDMARMQLNFIKDPYKRTRQKQMIFEPNIKKLFTIFDENGQPLGEMQHPLKFATANEQTANDFQIYWTYYWDNRVTVGDMLRPFLEQK